MECAKRARFGRAKIIAQPATVVNRGKHLENKLQNVAQGLKMPYNHYMETNYTSAQWAEFLEFCERHVIRFNTTLEMRAAIGQYFLGD